MKIRKSIPWICVSVLGLSLAVFGVDLLNAYQSFGHIPQYLIDTDPFHAEITWFLPDGTLVLYLISPVILIISALLLATPWTGYKGRKILLFYTFAIAVGVAHYLLLWKDVTGFVTWCTD